MPEWLLGIATRPSNTKADTGETTGPNPPPRETAHDTQLFQEAQCYADTAKPVEIGQRNQTAFNLAGHLVAFELRQTGERLDRKSVIDLVGMWNAKLSDPLDGNEIARTVDSAFNNGTPRDPHYVDNDIRARLPRVRLPGGRQTITETAMELGRLVSAEETHFTRGEAIARPVEDDGGELILQHRKPVGMASDFEAVANLVRVIEGREQPALCSESAARQIICADSFLNPLPPIKVLSRCPVLVDRDGKLIEISGYDRESGLLATGQPAAQVSVEDARRLIKTILADFHFATPSDRSRALAAIITPALVFGNLLGGRAPVDLGEADDSQAGKGYRNKITAAVFRHKVVAVTQRARGGVGSLEESFNSALVARYGFIAIDNVRGKVDSPAIESFMTEFGTQIAPVSGSFLPGGEPIP